MLNLSVWMAELSPSPLLFCVPGRKTPSDLYTPCSSGVRKRQAVCLTVVQIVLAAHLDLVAVVLLESGAISVEVGI